MKKYDPFPIGLPFTSLLKIFCFKFALINLCIFHLSCGQCACETNTEKEHLGWRRETCDFPWCVCISGSAFAVQDSTNQTYNTVFSGTNTVYSIQASWRSLCTTNILLTTPNTRHFIKVIKIQSMPPSVLELNELYTSLLSFISLLHSNNPHGSVGTPQCHELRL